MPYICPKCGRTSHNPNDARHRYCGACHEHADAGPPSEPEASPASIGPAQAAATAIEGVDVLATLAIGGAEVPDDEEIADTLALASSITTILADLGTAAEAGREACEALRGYVLARPGEIDLGHPRGIALMSAMLALGTATGTLDGWHLVHLRGEICLAIGPGPAPPSPPPAAARAEAEAEDEEEAARGNG